MKGRKLLNKTICLLIIMIMVLTSFFGLTPKKVEADNTVAGYITSLAPVIMKMPGCTKAIGSGITDLFNSVKNLFSSKAAKQANIDKLADKLKFTVGSDVVPTFDETTATAVSEVKDISTKTQKAVENQEKNQNCLNSIGKAIAKVLINETTDSIVNWIQTGDSGGPLFVQDLGAFSKSIAEDQILGFGTEINDPTLYPFGKAFMQSQAISFTSKFANNAQYSLDKMISDANPSYSAQTFNSDFSQGGWSAWDAMTQNPANNPLGFTLMASNELAKRIEEKTSLAQGSLQMSGGFLGVEKCVFPESAKGVTKEQDHAARVAGNKEKICTGWQVVTPGKLIGDELVSTVQKKDHALLDVQTLNDAMAAILDAVLAKFSSSLQSEGGLMSITESNPYEINDSAGFGNYQTENDYSEGQINASVWLQQNPNFDIRTDLNQAVIDEQRIYQDKLIEQNKEFISEVPASAEYPLGNYGLIPTIYQLDYCIPGPHPGWEADSRDSLDQAEAKVPDTTGMDWLTISQMTGVSTNNFGIEAYMILQAIPIIGSYVMSPESLDTWAVYLGSGNANCGAGASITSCVNRFIYQKALEDFTHIRGYRHDNNFDSYTKFTGIIDRIYSEYVKAIHNTYIPDVLPSATKEAETEFKKIPGYNQLINNNKKTIASLTEPITRLGEIKNEIETLNQELKDGKIKNAKGVVAPAEEGTTDLNGNIILGQKGQYEENLKPWKNAFVRLSLSMYSGDDIASADLLTKQIVDERDYVLNNLIKGSTGCEAELAKADSPLPKQLSPGPMLNRPDYPFPILYKYPDGAKTGVKGFLYYGSYVAWPFWQSSALADLQATKDLCKAYIKYGTSSEDGCNNGAALEPNYLYITDLFSWPPEKGPSGNPADGYPASTGILRSDFENKLQIY